MQKPEKKFWLPLLFFAIFAIGLLLGRLSFLYSDQLPVIYKKSKSDKILKLIDIINSQYVNRVNTDSVVDIVISDILSELDPHSTYFTSATYSRIRQNIEGEYFGIGIVFNTLIDTPVVMQVFDNSPARKAGIIIGDMLLKANGVNLPELTVDSIVSVIQDDTASLLKMEVYRRYNDTTLEIKLSRKKLAIPTVTSYFTDSSKNYLYVKIDHFSLTTSREFHDIIDTVNISRLKGIILDLQNNTGGILGSTIDILQEFFPKNTLLCYLKGRNIIKHKCYSEVDGKLKNVPLVVLINSSTASASEIIAGSLQDNDRAVIVGTRSFGKGLIQSEFQLSDGSVVRLTTSKYYTPSGRCLQKPYDVYLSDYLMFNDTVPLDTSEKYKTAGGRTVYGGGGVFPDIVIKDTLQSISYAASLYLVEVITRYGPVIDSFNTQKQVTDFTDTVFDFYVPEKTKISINYDLMRATLSPVQALKYYNSFSPVYQKALEILRTKQYEQILKSPKAK